MKVKGILALLIGLLMMGTAAAQDGSIECQLFGCPDDGGTTGGDGGTTGGDGGTTGGDGGTTGGDGGTTGGDGGDQGTTDETLGESMLPVVAAGQGHANSVKGLQKANPRGLATANAAVGKHLE